MSKTERWIDQIREGRFVHGDCGASSNEKPDWYEEAKFRRALQIFHDQLGSILTSHLLGLILMGQVPSLVEPLLRTGQHAKIKYSEKRAATTVQFVGKWYQGDIMDPGDPAHKNLLLVRSMHTRTSKKLNDEKPMENGEVWISQLDMSLTQFAFIGALVSNPKFIGFHGTDKDLEDFLYYWRCVGYLLGIEDTYNICGRNLAELRLLCQDIEDQIVIPTWANPREEYTRINEYAFLAFRKISKLTRFNSCFNLSCDVIRKQELKIRLSIVEYLCYWMLRFTFITMKYDSFRSKANKIHLETSNYKVDRILQNFETNEYPQEERVSLTVEFATWIYSWAKEVWSRLAKSWKRKDE